jgi:hypothetical protein
VRFALLVLVAGCGRLGFDAQLVDGDGHAGGDAGPGTIAVRVTGEGAMAGSPIGGAHVLVERGGAIDRVATAQDGSASFTVTGPTTFHVAYPVGMSWRVYTVGAARAGSTVQLGGSTDVPLSNAMTFSLPAFGSPGSYTLRLGRCASPPVYDGSSTFAIRYDLSCEGKTVHVYAFSAGSIVDRFIDAGDVPLVAGSSHTVTGAYTTLPPHTVRVMNVPAAASYLTAQLMLAAGDDVTDLEVDVASAIPEGSNATLAVSAISIANTLVVTANGFNGLPLSSYSKQSTPISAATGDVAFDAAAMLPMLTQLTIAPAPDGLAWQPSTPAGLLYWIDALATAVHWTAYVDAGVDHLAFPELPVDLAAATPDAWYIADVQLLAIPNAKASTLVQTIDRDRIGLAPATGWSESRILYVNAVR